MIRYNNNVILMIAVLNSFNPSLLATLKGNII